jgi:hypothetical protein
MTIQARVEVPTPGIRITTDVHRPWGEKLCEVVRALAAIDSAYDGEHLASNTEIEDRVRSFFRTCNEMREALIGEIGALPASASKTQINKQVFAVWPLKLCSAMANTTKHHTRQPTLDERDPISAQIAETIITGGKHARVSLRYWSPSTAEQLVDARKLAHECVEAWREFFKKHGIAEPQC